MAGNKRIYWLQRIFILEIGFILAVLPWTGFWDLKAWTGPGWFYSLWSHWVTRMFFFWMGLAIFALGIWTWGRTPTSSG